MLGTARIPHAGFLFIVGLLTVVFPGTSSGVPTGHDPHDAANVGYDGGSSGLAATTVQGAIDLLASNVAGAPPTLGYVHVVRFGSFTVPADRTLVITHTSGGFNGDPVLVGGAMVGGRSIGPSSIVVNEGESILSNTGGATISVMGYLVQKSKAPGVGIHLSTGGTYTVPAGKELVLTHAVVSSTFGLKVDGKGAVEHAPDGANLNILVGPGQTVTIDSPESGAHGYLR